MSLILLMKKLSAVSYQPSAIAEKDRIVVFSCPSALRENPFGRIRIIQEFAIALFKPAAKSGLFFKGRPRPFSSQSGIGSRSLKADS
jgi:hypothetical protein